MEDVVSTGIGYCKRELTAAGLHVRKLVCEDVYSAAFDISPEESMEIYITRHNPYPLSFDHSSNVYGYPEDDPPEVEGHLYQTTIWVDTVNEITNRRVAIDLTVLEEG
jgi:hypothetical protein